MPPTSKPTSLAPNKYGVPAPDYTEELDISKLRLSQPRVACGKYKARDSWHAVFGVPLPTNGRGTVLTGSNPNLLNSVVEMTRDSSFATVYFQKIVDGSNGPNRKTPLPSMRTLIPVIRKYTDRWDKEGLPSNTSYGLDKGNNVLTAGVIHAMMAMIRGHTENSDASTAPYRLQWHQYYDQLPKEVLWCVLHQFLRFLTREMLHKQGIFYCKLDENGKIKQRTNFRGSPAEAMLRVIDRLPHDHALTNTGGVTRMAAVHNSSDTGTAHRDAVRPEREEGSDDDGEDDDSGSEAIIMPDEVDIAIDSDTVHAFDPLLVAGDMEEMESFNSGGDGESDDDMADFVPESPPSLQQPPRGDAGDIPELSLHLPGSDIERTPETPPLHSMSGDGSGDDPDLQLRSPTRAAARPIQESSQRVTCPNQASNAKYFVDNWDGASMSSWNSDHTMTGDGGSNTNSFMNNWDSASISSWNSDRTMTGHEGTNTASIPNRWSQWVSQSSWDSNHTMTDGGEYESAMES